MNKDYCWKMIADANRKYDNDLDIVEALKEELVEMGSDEVFEWGLIMFEYFKLTFKNKFLALAYLINDCKSDDEFYSFASWLVLRGKRVFLNTLKNPDSLVTHLQVGVKAESKELLVLTPMIYTEKIGSKNLFDFYNKANNVNLSDEIRKDILKDIKYVRDVDAEWDDDDLEVFFPNICELLNYSTYPNLKNKSVFE